MKKTALLVLILLTPIALLAAAPHAKKAKGYLVTDAPCWVVHAQGGHCETDSRGLHVVSVSGYQRANGPAVTFEWASTGDPGLIVLAGQYSLTYFHHPKDQP